MSDALGNKIKRKKNNGEKLDRKRGKKIFFSVKEIKMENMKWMKWKNLKHLSWKEFRFYQKLNGRYSIEFTELQ